MRLACVIVAIVATAASADLVKEYSGRIVISPDPPPTIAGEIEAYVKGNTSRDDTYEVLKGSPWTINLVGVLSADVKTPVKLELVEDPKQPPLHVLDVTAKKRLVIATAKLTIAAGFAADKTYTIRLVAAKKVLAKAQVRLRD